MSENEQYWVYLNNLKDEEDKHKYISEWIKVLNMRLRPETSIELNKQASPQDDIENHTSDENIFDIPSVEEQKII